MAEQNDQEPSIEEILASIREIISDDDQPAAEAAVEPAPAPEPEPAAPADDILDLAAFASAPSVPADIQEDKPDPLSGIDFDKPKEQTVDFTDPLAEVAPEPEPEPVVASMPDVSMAAVAMPASVDSILGDHAKNASLDSMTRLAQNIAISRAGSEGTLEDIVRDMLKPMLRDWLDRNLPPMIERMVELELERIAKKAMDR